MARPLRVEYPGAYYHVVNRGNYRQKTFINDRDREKFLEYLQKASERFSVIIHTSINKTQTESATRGGHRRCLQ
jgi:putative transposase